MDRWSASIRPRPSRPLGWQVVPKPSGGTRRVVVLDPADEAAFARSVVTLVPTVRRALGPESHAGRVAGWDPHRGLLLEPWRQARRRWHDEVRRMASQRHRVAVTDVRECYGSITSRVVEQRLRAIGAPEDGIDEVRSWLRSFRIRRRWSPWGRSLPRYSPMSCSRPGTTLRRTGASFIRWVDDVVIFTSDRRGRERHWMTSGQRGHRSVWRCTS